MAESVAAPASTKKASPPPKRVIPVLVNRASNIQISAGAAKGGHFDGAYLLMLVSGVNLVPEEQWEAAKRQKSVLHLLSSKIRPTGAPEDAEARIGRMVLEEGEPLNAENPLLGLSDEDALTFVSNSESLALLKDLASQSASAPVMQAILQKVRRIEDPKAQPEKK